MNRVTHDMIVDHARIHAWLARACARETIDREEYAKFRSALLRHIAIEEKLLFPAVRQAQGGEPILRAHQLRVEHAALTSLLVPTPDIMICRDIEMLLAAHDAREEGPGGVYEECEHLLTEGESAALAQRAAVFPEVRVAPHSDGPGVHRTAVSALTSAHRMRPSAPRPMEKARH